MRAAPVQHRSVLITGCSSGIGLATARVLKARGWQVLPTARKQADLDMLEAEGFAPIELDVTDTASVDRAAARALALTGGPLGALVNNAGFGQAGAVEDLTREVLRDQFEVNLFGAHDLARRLIPVMRRQGWGRIVNVSSVLGRVTIPFYGSYCATKHAMESLTDALRIELTGSGLGISLVEPGPIISQFRKNAAQRATESLDFQQAAHGAYYEKEVARRIRQQKQPDAFTRPPEAVAEKIVHALESNRPRRRYCVTLPAYLGAFIRRFAPDALVDWVMRRKVPRSRFQVKSRPTWNL
jgi:NAD(P)-dependent dehydrogenase (short-subunit alcohol dehydrogenase family)